MVSWRTGGFFIVFNLFCYFRGIVADTRSLGWYCGDQGSIPSPTSRKWEQFQIFIWELPNAAWSQSTALLLTRPIYTIQLWITKKRNVRSTHAHKSVKRNKIGFSLQLKPNNILIKQSPNAHIPSLAGKSCIWANENNLVHTCLLQESALRTKELATVSFGRRGL